MNAKVSSDCAELSSPSSVVQFFIKLFEDKPVSDIRRALLAVNSGGYADLLPNESTACLAGSGLIGLLVDRKACLVE
jgi:hypothetical protein